MIERILSKLFRHEEINGGERCPTYLHRWTVFQPRWPRWLWGGVGVYIHKFVGDDWSRDLHDHPKRFVSIGLRGRYVEETPAVQYGEESTVEISDTTKMRVYAAPWVRSFPAHHIHRIFLLDDRPCWTFVIVLRHTREWGFWNAGRWIHWRTYVSKDNPVADARKSCP